MALSKVARERLDDEMLITWAVMRHRDAETPEGLDAAWKAIRRVVWPLLDARYPVGCPDCDGTGRNEIDRDELGSHLTAQVMCATCRGTGRAA